MRKITRFLLVLGMLTVLTLSSALATHAQSGAAQIKITQVDNSKFPQVTVYVSVTNAAGEPMAVDPATIQISENGQVMQQTSAGRGAGKGGVGPLATMLVMDVSGSMNQNGKIDGAKAAAKAYVNQMRLGDQTGVMVFNTKVNYIQPLTQDHAVLTSAIDGIKAGGDTAMYDALIAAEGALKDVSGRKAIIAVTDGLDNSSSHKSADVIAGIGPGGLSISTIGLGDPTTKALSGLDETGLKSLAQQAGGQYSYAGDAQTLSALFQSLGRELQSEYALTYTSPSTLRDGVNRGLTVALTGSPAVTAQSQYNPGGVLPEVPTQSWLLFGAILVGLLILLAIPVLLGLGSRLGGVGGGRRGKGRIKLSGGGPQPVSAARGRVKLK
jgi:VWFA-related protein